MNGGDWTRLWDRFHAALEVPDAARPAWLDAQACAPDERRELDALLAAHAREHATLDAPLLDTPGAGRRIGAWRLLHELGHGGMGAVWLAERVDSSFAQRAAIKFVSMPMAAPTLVARFRREQRILAALEHPDIARLLDGGVMADGLPWLAMEYIDGLPLPRWVRERKPPLAARLQLAARLCDAVHHAHQQLVVHRDLKPANVMVRAGDAPVLLDFGVAKLLDDGVDALRTGTALPALFTPAYASPEQLLGGAVGTASDVYSLGVLIYELLAGAPPFEASAQGWGAWIEQATQRAPAPPSARGGTLKLDRELDAIVLMALRKEPSRRYASAAALAEDLRRYLDRKPVKARPDTARYRIAKFVRRHRLGSVLALAAMLAVTTLGVRLAMESRRTSDALAESQRERARAEETVRFLTDIFRDADPTRGSGEPASARDLLERGVTLLETRSLDPASRAAVQTALGEIFVNAGDYARADELFAQALRDSGGVTALRADALHGQGGALQASARHAEARDVLAQALPLRREVYGDASLEVAATLDRIGAAEQALAHFDAAGAAYRESLAILESLQPRAPTRIADARLRLGALAWNLGHYDEAATHYDAALAIRRAHPAQAADLARVLDANGALAHVRGQHEQARGLYEEALQLRRTVLGNAHRLTADTLGNLGALAYDRGDPAAALPLLHEALAAQRAALGDASPVVAKTLNNLALAQAAIGKRDLARDTLEQALAINRKAFAAPHLRIAGNLNNLGLVLLDDGFSAQAERHFTDSLAAMETLLGSDDPQLGFVLTNRGRALAELQRPAEAAAMYERALALRRAHLDAAHPSLAETLTWQGVLACEQGDAAGGERRLNEALALRRRVFGEEHPGTAQSAALLGACLRAAGNAERAAAFDAPSERVRRDPSSGRPLLRRVSSATPASD
jgi:tetratricopeptide (TPR) repeat protein